MTMIQQDIAEAIFNKVEKRWNWCGSTHQRRYLKRNKINTIETKSIRRIIKGVGNYA